MRRVSDILQNKNKPFNQISSGSLVINALQMLNSVNLSYLIVMDGEEFKGIFSERDYTRNVILKGKASSEAKVAEVMSTDVPCVEVSETAEQCMKKMNTYRTRYLLAYDDEVFKGVITIHDLLREVISSKENVFDHKTASELITNDESGKIY